MFDDVKNKSKIEVSDNKAALGTQTKGLESELLLYITCGFWSSFANGP